jgi:hypothetical protein
VSQQIEIILVQSEGLPYLLHFVDEPVECPQVSVFWLIGICRAQLIIVDEFNPLGGEKTLETLEVFVCCSWSAVEQ